MQKTFVLTGFAIAALTSGAAMANDTIKAVNNKAALSWTTGAGFDFSKTDTDNLTSGENGGSQNGFTLSVSAQRELFGVADIYVGAEVSMLRGDTEYSGYVFDGTDWAPASGKTDYDSLDFSLKVGKGFAVSPTAQVTPYVTIGTRKWDRDSLDQGGYVEKHSNSFVGLGAMFQYALSDKLVLSVDGSYSANNSSEVNWVDGGETYIMGNKGTTQLGLGATYRVSKQLSVFADYRLAQTKFGTSNVVNGYAEQASTTKSQRVNAGVAYNF